MGLILNPFAIIGCVKPLKHHIITGKADINAN